MIFCCTKQYVYNIAWEIIKNTWDKNAKTCFEKRIKTAQKEIPKEVFTVANKVNYLKEYLLEKESCYFTELFHEHATRPEIITTFQALLELLKVQYLAAEQDGTYGDIIIKLREDRSDGDIGDLSEYNWVYIICFRQRSGCKRHFRKTWNHQ